MALIDLNSFGEEDEEDINNSIPMHSCTTTMPLNPIISKNSAPNLELKLASPSPLDQNNFDPMSFM